MNKYQDLNTVEEIEYLLGRRDMTELEKAAVIYMNLSRYRSSGYTEGLEKYVSKQNKEL